MEEDKQIQNVRCEKCGAKPEPGVCIMKFSGMWLCGQCYHDYTLKMAKLRKKEFLEE